MKILSICGSPRKGNSEAILLRLQQLFKEKGIDNEVIFLREKEINRCRGCVEYCNHKLKCQIQDDMSGIMNKMDKADRFVFISPNYFNMPTGLFKDFIDRCSIFFTSDKLRQFRTKKEVVVCVGAASPEETDICTSNIVNNFCKIMEMQVVGQKSFQGNSELKGNFNDIFESGLNLQIDLELRRLVDSLLS